MPTSTKPTNRTIVARYLESLAATYQTTRRTPEQFEARLGAVEESLAGDDLSPVKRLQLIQERLDIKAWLAAFEEAGEDNSQELEDEFVAVAAEFGKERGIAYATWRDIGVSAAVLRRAGISRAAS